jgi:DNA/RNA endonuclease G (NUC1)
LNRGVWRILEEQERNFAKTEPVFVTIRCIFDKTSVVLPTGAKVPSGFYKTIYLPKSNKTFIYYFPNEKPTKKTYGEYEVKK